MFYNFNRFLFQIPVGREKYSDNFYAISASISEIRKQLVFYILQKK